MKENTLSVSPFPDVPGPAAVRQSGLPEVQGNVLRLRASFVEVTHLVKGTVCFCFLTVLSKNVGGSLCWLGVGGYMLGRAAGEWGPSFLS